MRRRLTDGQSGWRRCEQQSHRCLASVTESRGNLRASPKSTAIQAPKSTLWTAFAEIGKLLQNAQNRVSASPARGLVRGRTRDFGIPNTQFHMETRISF